MCDPGPSDKQAVCVPDDLFNAVDSEPISSVSKNQLAAVLPRYSAYISDLTPQSRPLEEKHKQCGKNNNTLKSYHS